MYSAENKSMTSVHFKPRDRYALPKSLPENNVLYAIDLLSCSFIPFPGIGDTISTDGLDFTNIRNIRVGSVY